MIDFVYDLGNELSSWLQFVTEMKSLMSHHVASSQLDESSLLRGAETVCWTKIVEENADLMISRYLVLIIFSWSYAGGKCIFSL